MIMLMKILLLISLIGNICYADNTIYLNQNDKAPFNGYLFTEQKAKDIRVQLLEGSYYKDINDSITKQKDWLTENISKKDEQIKLLSDQNDKLTKVIMEEQKTSNWERTLYFTLGIVASGLAVYGASKLTK